MQLTERLSHIEYLQVTGSDSCEVFCGSDQEWFPAERQRLTGCGPSAAANILFYIERKENAGCCGRSRADLLSFMEEAWQSVTPEKRMEEPLMHQMMEGGWLGMGRASR